VPSKTDPFVTALEAAADRASNGPECKVCAYLRECEEPRATAVRQAFARGVGFRKLTSIFKANGVEIGWRAVKTHRDKEHTS
jgi:hypothetical protein